MMRTRAQDWSKRSFEAVSAQKGDVTGKYRTACMRMPGLIHQSGLLQAVVFVLARDEQGERYVTDVAGALTPGEDHAALIARAQSAGLAEYLALTRDVLEVTQWLRRFAQIELRDAS